MKGWVFGVFCLCSAVMFSQQTAVADFKTGSATIAINPYKKEVKGSVTYTFDMLKPADSVYIDARNMRFGEVTLNGKKADFRIHDTKLWLICPLRAGTHHTVTIPYTASPQKAMYFTGWDYSGARKQVWTQGQGKYTSHWLPGFDDVNEKVVFNFTITFNSDYEVLANGKLEEVSRKDSLTTWRYSMRQPMSSYLAAIAIGKYRKKTLQSEKGTPLELYYYPEDEEKATSTYRHTREIFDFLEKEIGVAYPWQNYKQVPVRDFLYAGMENTTLTLFSDAYVTDSIAFADRNYVNVNAHETAHQWFGNLVTAKSGTHHWLQEGFATYYALLAERAVFGEDHYYRKLYRTAEQLIAMSREGKGERLLDVGAGSLTFYEKGAWALHILRERTGDKAFIKAVKSYLLKHRFGTADTNDLIREMERESGKDLGGFVETWLEQTTFPEEEALRSLKKNNHLRRFFSLKEKETAEIPVDFSSKDEILLHIEIINRYKNTAPAKKIPVYRKALRSGFLETRQAVIMALDTVPPELKKEVESLLKDKSYLTIEKAVYTLWANFPAERKAYLDATRDITGFSDKNVELLWLALALLTPNYNVPAQPEYYRRLSGYTSPVYSYGIRQGAFGYLYRLQLLSDINLKDLAEACLHHTWAFASASRLLLERLLEQPEYRKRFQHILPELGEKEQQYLAEKLKK